jgi:alginate O-acetyltransferase complex protein AlgI
VGLAFHKWWTGRVKHEPRPFGGVIGWALTYVFVCVGWVFFRATSFTLALQVLRQIVGLGSPGVSWVYAPLWMLLPLIVVAHGVGVLVARQERAPGSRATNIAAPAWAKRLYTAAGSRFATRPHPAAGPYMLLPLRSFIGAFVVTVWLVGLLLFATIESTPFIYFQF